MRIVSSIRLVPVLALLGVLSLLAACGAASSGSQATGGLGQGSSGSSSAGDHTPADTTSKQAAGNVVLQAKGDQKVIQDRSEEHTSELQSPCNLVCRLLLEKKKHKG